MRTKKRRKIQRLVEQILRLAKVEKPPVPVEEIAQFLGAKVYYKELDSQDAVSGMLIRENDQAIIGVNKTHHEHRQRFTIAHELGHLELHNHTNSYVDRNLPSLVQLRDELSSLAIDPDEIEANAFAAELLMPTSMLGQDVQHLVTNQVFNEGSIDDLAEKYKVSIQAMTFRLINLGFIQD